MTYQEALAKLPKDARLSSTFGFEGNGGYSEVHRTDDGRVYWITNGSYLESYPYTWSVEQR